MCTQPITINSKGTIWSKAKSIQVPCGKCLECKIKYQNEWYIRLLEESKLHQHICLVTLTYSDKNVPWLVNSNTGEAYRTVNKKHVQDWLKRFRTRYERQYGKTKKFKYFYTSEYGPTTFRPHGHGVFFGLSKLEIAPLLNDWRKRYGFVKVSWINPLDQKHKTNAMRYVAKYCSKGEFECPLVEQGKVLKTFHLISKKIGYEYIPRNINYHLSTSVAKYKFGRTFNPAYLHEITAKRFYFLDNFRYSLPRYYKNKIYGEQTRLSYAIADYLYQESLRLCEEQLEAIQSERNCSYLEANNIYTNLLDSIHSQRYAKAKRKYIQFLTKSQI